MHMSFRVLYHYTTPDEIIELDVTYEQNNHIGNPNGLWMSTKGESNSWDTWRKKVDPDNEPLADDLKKLYKLTLKENVNLCVDKGIISTMPHDRLARLYSGIADFHDDDYVYVCLWDMSVVEKIEELPSPFLVEK